MSNHAHRRPRPFRPTPAQLDVAARASCIVLGCTCRPDLGRLRHGEITSLSVAHDDDCPAADAGSLQVAILTGGRP